MSLSNKQKFNKKFGFKRDESHSLDDIVKITGIKKSILEDVYARGLGARVSNPESVRSVKTGKKVGGKTLRGKMSGPQWALARVYGFVMQNPKQVAKGAPDRDLWDKMLKK